MYAVRLLITYRDFRAPLKREDLGSRFPCIVLCEHLLFFSTSPLSAVDNPACLDYLLAASIWNITSECCEKLPGRALTVW